MGQCCVHAACLFNGIVLLSIITHSALASDVAHQWVAESRSPHGERLASGYVADVKITDQPAVIFAHNFEEGEMGAKWDEANNAAGKALSLVDQSSEPAPVGIRSLKVTATLGENTGGGFS